MRLRFAYVYNMFKKSIDKTTDDGEEPQVLKSSLFGDIDINCYVEPALREETVQPDNDNEKIFEADIITCIGELQKFLNYESMYSKSMVTFISFLPIRIKTCENTGKNQFTNYTAFEVCTPRILVYIITQNRLRA